LAILVCSHLVCLLFCLQLSGPASSWQGCPPSITQLVKNGSVHRLHESVYCPRHHNAFLLATCCSAEVSYARLPSRRVRTVSSQPSLYMGHILFGFHLKRSIVSSALPDPGPTSMKLSGAIPDVTATLSVDSEISNFLQ